MTPKLRFAFWLSLAVLWSLVVAKSAEIYVSIQENAEKTQ
jgi:hypothetical protein